MKNTKKGVVLLVCGLLLLLLPGLSEAGKVKVRVTVEKANVRLKPDLGSPVISSAPLGAVFESEEQTGEWFKVNLPPDEQGFVVTGYLHSSVVELVAQEAGTAPVTTAPVTPPATQQPAYQAYQPAPKAGMGFGVKISGGLAYITGGDANKGIKGFNDYAQAVSDYWGGSVKSELSTVHLGMDFGGEFIFYPMPDLGVALGVGYIQASKESTIEYLAIWTESSTIKPKASAIPITLGVYYYLPMGSSMRLAINAGAGYYLGKFSYTDEYSSLLINGKEEWTASKGTLGFQGGIGFEFDFSPNMALVFDIFGRYASFNFKDVTGDYTDKGTSIFGPYDISESDYKLWMAEYEFDGEWYPLLALDDTEPSGSDVRDAKEAKIDLSGIAAKIGLKITF